ncbi:MAG: 7TM diverse intracellular signaling domain-containing protein, partial [Bacteroidia bacterium]
MRKFKPYCLLLLLLPLLGLAKTTESVYQFKGAAYTQNIIELKGPWQFYWNKTAQQVLNENPEYTSTNVPGSWSSEAYSNVGYATYRFKFTHDYKIGEVLGIKMYSISSAYNLYVNGEKLGGVGHFSCNADTSKPDYFPRGFYFTVQSDTVDILVEVSNYQYRQSGIWITPIMGKASLIKSNSYFNLVGYSALIGALFIMGLYFLAFYYTKTTEKSIILFAFTCFAAAFRIGSTGEIIFRQIDLLISWESLVKMEFISFCMMMLFGVLYLQSLFKQDVNMKVSNGISAINIVFAFLFLLLPIKTGSYLIPPYLFIVLLQLAYLFQLIIKVIIHKRKLSGLIGGAYLLIFILGLNDILLSQEYINSVFLAPLG